ncbi:hypothetical protein D3C72_2181600 [compost metagenome]
MEGDLVHAEAAHRRMLDRLAGIDVAPEPACSRKRQRIAEGRGEIDGIPHATPRFRGASILAIDVIPEQLGDLRDSMTKGNGKDVHALRVATATWLAR